MRIQEPPTRLSPASCLIFLRDHWPEYAPLVVIGLLGFLLRLWTIGYGTNVDEGDYLMQGRELLRGHWPYRDVHLNKPPLVSMLGFPFFLFWKVPILPARVFMILVGVSSLWAIYVLGKELFDEPAGIFAAVGLALDPYSAIWAKYLHVSTLTPALSLWSLAFLIHGLKREKIPFVVLSGFFSSLCLLNKQTGIFLLPLIGLCFLWFWPSQKGRRMLLNYCLGFIPLPLIVFGIILALGAMEPFLYDLIWGNLAMSGFFHETMLDRWNEFRAIEFLNPLWWRLAVLGIGFSVLKRVSGSVIALIWLILEFGVNLFGLSHVWPHYVLAIMPPAYLLTGFGLSAVSHWVLRNRAAWAWNGWLPIAIALLCAVPFWPRSNWAYPNLTLDDERALAAFFQRHCPSRYFLCFADSAFYIWTGKEVPPSIRGDRRVRIPPFMNTAGRKYLSLEDMKKTVQFWEILPMDFCVMYGKYYRQIFEERDPQVAPVREFLEREFERTQVISTKPTYYAQIIGFQRKSNK